MFVKSVNHHLLFISTDAKELGNHVSGDIQVILALLKGYHKLCNLQILILSF